MHDCCNSHFSPIGLLTALLLCVGCVSTAAVAGQTELATSNEYRVPLTGEPTTLDPALFSDVYAMQVANNLYDGLVEFDQDLNVVPAIARRWKISRDHRTYTFFLREGVTFHNGREVNAGDFVYSFTRVLDPNIKSPAAGFFLNIKGAEAFQEGKVDAVSGLQALGPNMLKIELKEPFAPFLSILAMANAKVVPQEAIGPEFGTHPTGTGPFRFSVWQPEQGITLEANKDYFAGRPFVDSVRFRIYPNIEWEQIFTDFENGMLEHALIPSERHEQFVQDETHQGKYGLISKSGLNIVYVGMNQGVPPFDNLSVRQAINYAVDTDTIVKTITKRGATPIKGILPPGVAGFDPEFRGYGYDPQRARQLLATAGYPQGQGFPTIGLWTVSKSSSVHQELEAYKRYLADVGLTVEIHIAESWKAFVQAITDKKAGMFYAAWYADYPDADNFFYPLMHSSSRTNRMMFQDPSVDRLLDQARSEMDYLQRSELYRDIEMLVVEKAPIISQHINGNNYLLQSWVKGVEMSPLGVVYLPLRQVQLDWQQAAQKLSLVNPR